MGPPPQKMKITRWHTGGNFQLILQMIVTLTIIRYPRNWMAIPALLSMAFFHLPLMINRKIGFYKLMGTGKNGTFDKNPEWCQWAILAAYRSEFTGSTNLTPTLLYGNVIAGWFRLFRCETCTFYLQPIEGHGTWDGREPFGTLPKQSAYTGPVGILTRATIRLSKAGRFWSHVEQVATRMAGADGFIFSIGIGEMPFLKQATFSIWKNKESMHRFAYQLEEHADVIRKTRKEKWYSEDMFVRFIPLKVHGTIQGSNPLSGIA